MTYVLLAWLVSTVLFGIITSWSIWVNDEAKKYIMLSFLLGSPLTAFCVFSSAGWSTPCIARVTAPVGTYDVIGYHLEMEKKIHLILNLNNEPRICYIPWNVQEAEDLQKTENMEFQLGEWEGESGDGDGNGGSGLRKPPVKQQPPKSEETP